VEVVMNRGSAVAMAFVVVGGLGTALMARWDAFSIGFSFLFWGGLAAAITWIAGGRGRADQADAHETFNPATELSRSRSIHHSELNPATGLPMTGDDCGVDVGGNIQGMTDALTR
jgi:hypothetical protein